MIFFVSYDIYVNSSTKFKATDFTVVEYFPLSYGLCKLIMNLITGELDTIFIQVF